MIARAAFYHPDTKRVKKTRVVPKSFFNKVAYTQEYEEIVKLSLNEVIDNATAFASKISPDNLVNIVEYRSAYERLGDDGQFNIVIYYRTENGKQ